MISKVPTKKNCNLAICVTPPMGVQKRIVDTIQYTSDHMYQHYVYEHYIRKEYENCLHKI